MRHTVATYFSSSGLCDNGTIAVKLILLVNTRSTVLYNVSQQNKVGFSKKNKNLTISWKSFSTYSHLLSLGIGTHQKLSTISTQLLYILTLYKTMFITSQLERNLLVI